MVSHQRLATLNPKSPNPSVEAILHAIIPLKFVDHTHADSVLAISNTPSGDKRIKEIYDDRILIVPYVMPGFELAKKVAHMVKTANWKKLEGMILLNHGVFSFGNTARVSYERMIKIVSKAEQYIKKNTNLQHNKKVSIKDIKLKKLAEIRQHACKMAGYAVIAKFDNSSKYVKNFLNMPNSEFLCSMGTLTPDHVIRTKPFAWKIEKNIKESSKHFIESYEDYFNKYSAVDTKKLDNCPKWGVLRDYGIVYFGKNQKEIKVIKDINKHTLKTIQVSESIDKWKPLSFDKLFEIEYWELEQAKLKKVKSNLKFQGKIALITGAASGIGKACAKSFLESGCCVIGIDINPKIKSLFTTESNYLGIECDLTKEDSIRYAIEKVIKNFGGIDILISNAGDFPKSKFLSDIESKKWENDIKLNLTSHHYIYKESVPYLKLGNQSNIVFIGSRNMLAPGPGAGTYSIAKSGLTQMSRLAAIELAKYGIRVNIIHPDCVFDTQIWNKEIISQRAKKYGLTIEQYKRKNLLKTSVSSSDVASLVEFIASEKSSKITGSQIPIDGGVE